MPIRYDNDNIGIADIIDDTNIIDPSLEATVIITGQWYVGLLCRPLLNSRTTLQAVFQFLQRSIEIVYLVHPSLHNYMD